MLFPVYLNLRGKRVLVVGGGTVAERKVTSLLGTEAWVTVISPEITPRLLSLAKTNAIEWKNRTYTRGDCSGAVLVFSATDNPEVNRAVWDETSSAGILVNTADQPDLCSFMMPSVVRRGDLSVAISTNGRSPALAATLREQISEVIGPEYSELLELLSAVRAEIQERFKNHTDRKVLHQRILESDVITLIKKRDYDGAARLARELIEDYALQEKAL
jgi:precorrin-2 dehydrogenase/sirohydrochlorin ferrochelatase